MPHVKDPVPSIREMTLGELLGEVKSLEDPLLGKRAVAEMLSCTVRSLERYLSRGTFPRPLRIGGSRGCLRWRRSTVEAYLDKLSRETA